MTDPAPAPPLAKKPTRAHTAPQIVAQLTEAIHERRLQPGLKLSEDEVGEVFGAGRSVVRQALRDLAHEGLLTIERNRGAFVAKPSVKDAQEVFEARLLLEPRTARAAALRMTHADISSLEAHLTEEHEAVAAGETGRALKLSGRFHIEIARIADQTTVEDFIRQLVSRSSLVIALYWRQRNALCESHAHHALLKALSEHDGDAAEELMREHLHDLVSQLDLSPPETASMSLREALRP